MNIYDVMDPSLIIPERKSWSLMLRDPGKKFKREVSLSVGWMDVT